MSQLYTPFRYDFVGSFLRPEYLKKARADYEAGAMSAEELKKTEDKAITELVAKQKEAGYQRYYRRRIPPCNMASGFYVGI